MMEKRSTQAISDAFDSAGIEPLLRSLDLRSARISSIQETASDLTPWIAGGPFRRGETFITSFWDVYQSLNDGERRRVDAYFKSKIESVPDAFKKQYPKVFR